MWQARPGWQSKASRVPGPLVSHRTTATLVQERPNARVSLAPDTPLYMLSPEHGSHLFPMIAQARDLGNQDVQNVLEMMMFLTHVDGDSFPFASHSKKAESTLTNGRAYSSFVVGNRSQSQANIHTTRTYPM